jgi:FKBP-type peptidyl-prolyl cis-trans isomerase FklB
VSHKYQLIAILGAASFLTLQAFAGTAAQATITTPSLESASQKLSYTIGYEMGQNFKAQNIQIDPNILVNGLQDGLAGNKPILDKEARQQTIINFQKEIIAKQEQNYKKLADQNSKDGETFLAENAKKPGVKTLDSGLQYKVVKEGTGPKPTLNDTVTVNYSGSFINGKVFDSSYQRGEPATFPLNQVIQGWQDALTNMPVGSIWEVYLPPKLAYGERGMGNVIGPNETLVFKIELLSISKATT